MAFDLGTLSILRFCFVALVIGIYINLLLAGTTDLPIRSGSITRNDNRILLTKYKVHDLVINGSRLFQFEVKLESGHSSSIAPDKIAVCLTRSFNFSPKYFQKKACGGNLSITLIPDIEGAQNDKAIVSHRVVYASKSFFIDFSATNNVDDVYIIVENHNFLLPLSLKYSISASLSGPLNPVYWWYRCGIVEIWRGLYRSANKELLETLTPHNSKFSDQFIFSLSHSFWPALNWRQSSCLQLHAHRLQCEAAHMTKRLFDTTGVLEGILKSKDFCAIVYSEYFIIYVIISINAAMFCMISPDDAATSSMDPFSPLRLAAAMFSHWDGVHLCLNMYSLYIVGPELCRYGLNCDSVRLLLCYILSGVAGSVLSLCYRKRRGVYGLAVGASGAVAGMQAALYVLRPHYGDASPLQALLTYITVDIARNVLFGRNIDIACHVGGAVGGYIYAQVVLKYF